MGLRFKFNLVIFSSLLLGFVVVFWMYYNDVRLQNTLNMEQKAAMVFQTAESIRSYNNQEVVPLLEQLNAGFLPQAVGSYAATGILKELQQSVPEMSYKVAIDNSNIALYRPNIWEKNIILEFQSKPALPILTQKLADAQGSFFVYAKPIVSGNEVSGAKIVRINQRDAEQKVNQSLSQFIVLLSVLLLVIMLALNFMMHLLITKPLGHMANQAEKISQGQSEVDELDVIGQDEISQLGHAFNRLQRSLKAAMSMLS